MSAFYTTVARFYDSENADKTDDLEMYSRLAAEHDGEILDVGCGTGRVLLHLAREGRRAHGIDNDRAMLDRLDAKLAQMPQLQDYVSYICGDILDHQWRQPFSLILLTYNALMHFHEQVAQIALLGRLRACLAAGGRLVIDLPNAGPAFAAEDSDALTFERSFLDRDTGHLVMLQSLNYLDRAQQMLTVEWIYDEMDGSGALKRLIAPHKLRYFFLPELQLLLERAGFTVRAVYGEPDGAPYDADSERMIVHAAGK
jgi:SAM-dependent methyltransferase